MKTKKTPKKLNTFTGEEFKMFKKKLDDSSRRRRKIPGKFTKSELKRIKRAADLINTGGTPISGQHGMAIMSETTAKKFAADKHFTGGQVLLDDISKLAKHGERNKKPINYIRADGSRPLSKEHRKLYANRLYVANNRNLIVELKSVSSVNGGEIAYQGYIWYRAGADGKLTPPMRMSWGREAQPSARDKKHPHGFHFKSDTNDPAFFIIDDATTNDLATELFRKIEEKPEEDVPDSTPKPRYEWWSAEELAAEASIAWFRPKSNRSVLYRVTKIEIGDIPGSYAVEFNTGKRVHISELAAYWEYKYFSDEFFEKDPWKPCGHDTTPDEGDC